MLSGAAAGTLKEKTHSRGGVEAPFVFAGWPTLSRDKALVVEGGDFSRIHKIQTTLATRNAARPSATITIVTETAGRRW
jgi:hypothetical protein